MTLQLEISSDNDLQIFLSLAKRLKIKTHTVESEEPSIYESLTWKQVEKRLQNAENQSGIGMDKFIEEIGKWK